MPYDVLEKQIKALPEDALIELVHYVEFLTSVYNRSKKEKSLTIQINDFYSPPGCF